MKIDFVSRRFALLIGVALVASPALLMAQAGSLDPTFGTGGIVTTSFSGFDDAVANVTVIQSDGKILVAGQVPSSQNFGQVGLARYNTDGSLDSSFGTGGIVSTSQSGAIFGMAVLSDGKIVVGGAGVFTINALRFNSNGTLDTTFGTQGIASVRPFAPNAFVASTGGMALQTDGKILVAGADALVRFTANGDLDTSFGSGGVATLVSTATAITLLSNGKILVASSFNSLEPALSGTIARYNSNGSLDTTFGLNGQISTVGPASAIALLSTGQFIVGGSFPTAIGNPPSPNSYGVALTRYNANGSIDTTFGKNGGVVAPFAGNTDAVAFAVAIQSNGEIVAAGQAGSEAPDGPSSFALARFTANGQIDTGFGTNGTVTTTLGNNTAFVSALAIQSDGKIVAVGNDEAISDEGQVIVDSFALARYLAD
jgi:uncharacterized delta-60 repeat protein